MVLRHPEFPVEIWIVREPALADEELQHRAQWPDRFQHLPSIGKRVRGAEKTALAADETDNRAAMGREGPPPQAALEARDHEALVDTARVEERKPKRPRRRSFLARIGHTAEPTTAHQALG